MVSRKEDRRLARFIIVIMAVTMGFLLFAFLISAMGPVLTPILVSFGLPILWLISGGFGLIFMVHSLREIVRKGVTRRIVYLRFALGIALLWIFIYGTFHFLTYVF